MRVRQRIRAGGEGPARASGTAAGVLAAAVLLLTAFAAEAKVDFLVPGVSLQSVAFEEGASVSYMIVSEAYGVRDTTMAGLSVIESGPEGIVLEVVSSSWPVVASETVTARLEMDAAIVSASTTEEVRSLIRKVLVSEGGGAMREPTGEELDDFGMERLFIRDEGGMDVQQRPSEHVATPAGEFLCDVTIYSRASTRRVDLGGVGAERTEEETSTLMTSKDVPFWGLVRSRVERSSWTKLDSSRRGGSPRAKVTITESILSGFSRAGAR